MGQHVIMDIPKKRKKSSNVLEDEGTSSDLEDFVTDNNLINQILRICCKTANNCIGCLEIRNLIESSSSSSPDSGFPTSSSKEPLIISQVNKESACIKNMINKKKENKLKSNKKPRSVEKLPQRKRAKVDLIANQKKIDKVFNKLLENYKRNSLVVSTKKNESSDSSKERIFTFDLDNDDFFEHDKIGPPEMSQADELNRPSTSRHIFSTEIKDNSKEKLFKFDLDNDDIFELDEIGPPGISQGDELNRPSTSQHIFSTEIKDNSKEKLFKFDLDNDDIFELDEIGPPGISQGDELNRPSTSGHIFSTEIKDNSKQKLFKFDLDNDDIFELDEFGPPGISQGDKFIKPSTTRHSMGSTITRRVAQNKRKLSCDLLDFEKFDLDGNKIIKNGKTKLDKRRKISQSEKSIRRTTNPYSLRSLNTVTKAENCAEHSYTLCRQKLDFGESTTKKPKAKSSSEPKSKKKLDFKEANGRSKSRKSLITKLNKTFTTANNNHVTEMPARILYDEDSFMHSALFDGMFELNE